MTAVHAGDHGQPLPVVHADLGVEGLYRHLAEDHERPVKRARGANHAQHVHTRLHEEGDR